MHECPTVAMESWPRSPPRIGLGIDIVNNAEYIDGILTSATGRYQYLEVFDAGHPERAQKFRERLPSGLPLLQHNPVLDICGARLAPPQVIERAARAAMLTGASWCVEEMGYSRIEGHQIPYFMPAVLTEEVAVHTARQLRELQQHFPCLVAPENPAFEAVLGTLPLGKFVRIVASLTDQPLVLDITHVLTYTTATGRSVEEALEDYPLDRVIEVHLAGGVLIRGEGFEIFRDVHGAVAVPAEVMSLFSRVLPQLTNLRAITVEVDGGAGTFAVDDLEQAHLALVHR